MKSLLFCRVYLWAQRSLACMVPGGWGQIQQVSWPTKVVSCVPSGCLLHCWMLWGQNCPSARSKWISGGNLRWNRWNNCFLTQQKLAFDHITGSARDSPRSAEGRGSQVGSLNFCRPKQGRCKKSSPAQIKSLGFFFSSHLGSWYFKMERFIFLANWRDLSRPQLQAYQKSGGGPRSKEEAHGKEAGKASWIAVIFWQMYSLGAF